MSVLSNFKETLIFVLFTLFAELSHTLPHDLRSLGILSHFTHRRWLNLNKFSCLLNFATCQSSFYNNGAS